MFQWMDGACPPPRCKPVGGTLAAHSSSVTTPRYSKELEGSPGRARASRTLHVTLLLCMIEPSYVRIRCDRTCRWRGCMRASPAMRLWTPGHSVAQEGARRDDPVSWCTAGAASPHRKGHNQGGQQVCVVRCDSGPLSPRWGGACSPRAPRPRWCIATALALPGEKQAKTWGVSQHAAARVCAPPEYALG